MIPVPDRVKAAMPARTFFKVGHDLCTRCRSPHKRVVGWVTWGTRDAAHQMCEPCRAKHEYNYGPNGASAWAVDTYFFLPLEEDIESEVWDA